LQTLGCEDYFGSDQGKSHKTIEEDVSSQMLTLYEVIITLFLVGQKGLTL